MCVKLGLLGKSQKQEWEPLWKRRRKGNFTTTEREEVTEGEENCVMGKLFNAYRLPNSIMIVR